MTTTTKKAPAAKAGANAKKSSVTPGHAHRCVIRIASGEFAGEFMARDGSSGTRATAHVFASIDEALLMLANERQEGEHFEILEEGFEETGDHGGIIYMTATDVDAFFAPDTFAVLVREQRVKNGAPDTYLTADGGFSEEETNAKRFGTRLEAAAWRDKQRKFAPQFYSQYEPRWVQLGDAEPADAALEAEVAHEDPAYAPATETTVQGELLPPDAGTVPVEPVETTGLELDAPGQARLVALALSRFAADLGKLAKSERDLGRTTEAASAERDAKLIREELLAQLEPQAVLPFGYGDLRGALTARVAGKFRARLASQIRRDTPVVAGEATQDREAKIVERIADFESLVGSAAEVAVSLVEPIVREAAERGMLAGRLARETTAATLGCEAVAAVEREQ